MVRIEEKPEPRLEHSDDAIEPGHRLPTVKKT